LQFGENAPTALLSSGVDSNEAYAHFAPVRDNHLNTLLHQCLIQRITVISPLPVAGLALVKRAASVVSTKRVSCSEALASGIPLVSAIAMSLLPLPCLVLPTHVPFFSGNKAGIDKVRRKLELALRECPQCLQRHKPKGREYRCPACGFRFHRDGVGAINIRRKYLGSGPVVGVMASPTGVRWRPHACVARLQRQRIPWL